MEVKLLTHPTARERSAMVQVLTDSFWRTPLFTDFLFRGRKLLARLFLDALVQYGLKVGRMYVTMAQDGRIVACALWSLPDSPVLKLSTYLKLGMWPTMLAIAVLSPAAMIRINELLEMLEHFAPDTRCVTLEFLASSQKGAGAYVVRQSMAAFAGMPLYVESIVATNEHAFYRQFGFVPFARTDFHGTDYAFMLAAPAESAGVQAQAETSMYTNPRMGT